MLAFTLARTNFRENDQVISFYTRDAGKIEPIARGVKKIVSKNAPALEPFSLLDIEVVPGKNYSYVTKAYVVENFPFIRNDIEKMSMAAFAISLINKIVKIGERDVNIFKLLHSFDRYLNTAEEISALLPAAFAGRLVCFLGFTPILGRCALCGKNKLKKIFFSAEDGGKICETCSIKKAVVNKQISTKTLKILRSVFVDSWSEVSAGMVPKNEMKQVTDLVFDYLSYHFGLKIRPLGIK